MSQATSTATPTSWDVIVIGSGMGGLVAAAALSRLNHKVLLLEQYNSLGGQTHSFSRDARDRLMSAEDIEELRLFRSSRRREPC